MSAYFILILVKVLCIDGKQWSSASAAVTQSELALVPSNSTQHTTSSVLSDHHDRWSPKSLTSMDILQAFYRGGP